MSTEVKVSQIPECDLCRERRNKSTPAEFDGKTVFGPWANMCREDFMQFGVGLGTGLGQRLIQAT